MKYLVAWDHDHYGVTVRLYYQGWCQQNAEPMYSPSSKDARRMSRTGARNAAKRLRNPQIWGVPAMVLTSPN